MGDIPGSTPKPKTIDLEQYGVGVHEYAPTTGTPELRDAVANYCEIFCHLGFTDVPCAVQSS